MQGEFQFEKNGMSFHVKVAEDRVLVSVAGVEVYQLTEKETGTVVLAAFSKVQAGKHFLNQEQKYFAQKIS